MSVTEPGTAPREVSRGRWRIRPIGGWIAGVVAGVVSALIAAYLLAPRQSPPDSLPFTVAVVATGGPAYVYQGVRSQAPARPGSSDWVDWAARAGAVPTSLSVLFTVQGTSEAQVTLTDLRVRVVQRRPAVAGVLFQAGGGGPERPFRAVTVNLDTHPPTMRQYYDEDHAEAAVPAYERKPIVFPYQVAISDAETFLISASAWTCLCDWVVELSWASQGRHGTFTVDDGGKPFRVSGAERVTETCTSFETEICSPGSWFRLREPDNGVLHPPMRIADGAMFRVETGFLPT